MSSYTELTLDKFARSGVLVDTNLLLLHFVGTYDLGIVERGAFNRLASYGLQDFLLLQRILSLFPRRLTTPYVLSEVSNWIGKLPRNQEIDCLKRFAETLASFEELVVTSSKTASHARFSYLGLTDTALAEYANEYLVLTDDARFTVHLSEMGLDALNINHLRQEVWLVE